MDPASYEYIYFGESFDYPKLWKPNAFYGANDFNNRGWVVGKAENMYGEEHGVLLVPVSEQTQQVQNME